jgi:hypothetical protein
MEFDNSEEQSLLLLQSSMIAITAKKKHNQTPRVVFRSPKIIMEQ